MDSANLACYVLAIGSGVVCFCCPFVFNFKIEK